MSVSFLNDPVSQMIDSSRVSTPLFRWPFYWKVDHKIALFATLSWWASSTSRWSAISCLCVNSSSFTLDRCTRRRAAMLTPSKEDVTLLKAIDALRASIHGPPNELTADSEAGSPGEVVFGNMPVKECAFRRGQTMRFWKTFALLAK